MKVLHTSLLAALSLAASIQASAVTLDISGKFGPNTSDVDPITFGGSVINGITGTIDAPSGSLVSGSTDNLVDGSLATLLRIDVDDNAGASSTITWTLDTNTNPLGYDLEEVRVYTRQDNALVFHSYDVEVLYVGGSSFVKLNDDPIVYPGTERGVTLEDDFFGTGQNYVETIVSASDATYLAQGVAQFRLTVYPTGDSFGSANPVFATLANSVKGMQMTNVDVLGSATVPESSSFASLTGLAALAAIYTLRRRR